MNCSRHVCFVAVERYECSIINPAPSPTAGYRCIGENILGGYFLFQALSPFVSGFRVNE